MEKEKFDYTRLKVKIFEKFGSQKAFAERLGISPAVLSLKLSGRNYFSQRQIYQAIDALGLSFDDIHAYFFTTSVEKIEP